MVRLRLNDVGEVGGDRSGWERFRTSWKVGGDRRKRKREEEQVDPDQVEVVSGQLGGCQSVKGRVVVGRVRLIWALGTVGQAQSAKGLEAVDRRMLARGAGG